MSVSAKAAEFPVPCANSACGRELCGPVKHCPFCGHAVQRAVPVVTPATPAVKPAPVETPAAEPLHFDLGAVQSAAPIPSAPAQPTAAPKVAAAPPNPAPASPGNPAGLAKKLALSFSALLIIAGATSYYLSDAKQNQQDLEQALLSGQQCLRAGDYNCAQDTAERMLQKDRSDRAAQSLLQQAKDARERDRKDRDEKLARAQAEKDAAQKHAQQQAESDRQAREAREQAEKDSANQIVKAAPEPEIVPTAKRPTEPKAKPTPPPVVGGANQTMLRNTLNEANRALDRKDYQSAITVAGLVLNMDPGNRQAQNIINQARQQQSQALNRTTIE